MIGAKVNIYSDLYVHIEGSQIPYFSVQMDPAQYPELADVNIQVC